MSALLITACVEVRPTVTATDRVPHCPRSSPETDPWYRDVPSLVMEKVNLLSPPIPLPDTGNPPTSVHFFVVDVG